MSFRGLLALVSSALLFGEGWSSQLAFAVTAPAAVFKKAQNDFDRGDYGAVLSSLERFDDPPSEVLKGEISKLLGLYDGSGYFAKASQGETQEWRKQLYLANAYLRKEEFSQAYQLLFKARLLQPKNGEVVSTLGRCLYRSDHLSDGIKTMQEGIALSPRSYICYANLAESYSDASDLDRALKVWSKLIAIYPSMPAPLVERAKIYTRLPDDKAAERDFFASLRLNPSCIFSLSELAAFYQWRGDAPRTIKYATQCLAVQPGVDGITRKALHLRARAFAASGKHREAVADLDQLLQEIMKSRGLSRENRAILVERAANYEAMKQYKKAVEDAGIILYFKPGNGEALKIRARNQLKLKEFRLALFDLNQLAGINGSDADLFDMRAAAYKGLGQNSDAEKDRQRARQLKNAH